LIQELKGRLVLNASAQLQLADKARKNPQLVGKSNIEEPLYPPAVHMNLHLFFSAAALWLSDARIQTKDFVVDALTDKVIQYNNTLTYYFYDPAIRPAQAKPPLV